jgi:hypothetical protein
LSRSAQAVELDLSGLRGRQVVELLGRAVFPDTSDPPYLLTLQGYSIFWFELMPDKITYGSDAFPIDDKIGAEELYWFGVHSARTATAAALAEMIAAREISEQRAMSIARGYLHDNAASLYK